MAGAFVAPAVAIGIAGLHVGAVPALLIFGAAVVAASFLLAWAAEAAQIDVSGGLATALLALIAVLPEYAVDL
ncbi:sodium:proton exchanger, partial [Mycobacterium tuberculosis]|nr:sodium:proton exchanger [Mycobacterium tuberculosis]